MEYLPLLLMLVLFALNVPVAMAMGIGAISYFVFKADELPLQLFAQRLISSTDSFPLLAVPFFILASVIMNHAGITRRLMAGVSASSPPSLSSWLSFPSSSVRARLARPLAPSYTANRGTRAAKVKNQV
jgi:TRAP-type mannitol/chloroaromatic compound transport system permease large subunit